MEFLWGLFASVLSAFFCYFIADRNNMSKIGWPLFGFLIPVLGAIVTMIVAFMKQKDPA